MTHQTHKNWIVASRGTMQILGVGVVRPSQSVVGPRPFRFFSFSPLLREHVLYVQVKL